MPYHFQLGSIWPYLLLGSIGPYHLQLCSLCPIIFGLAAYGPIAAWSMGPIIFSLVAYVLSFSAW